MNMNLKAIAFLLFLSGSLFAKPNIDILATGGTIAGSSGGDTNTSYKSGAITVDALISAVPGIKKIANITGEQISNIGSQEMNDKVWFDLAKSIQDKAKSDKYDGFVVTHGTDTMDETAFFLNLVVNTKKPIILVGAMRNSDSMSADGPLNLFNAVHVASDKNSYDKGVLVVMNDTIHAAREVTKTNTTNVETFKSLNTGPIGTVFYGNVKYYMQPTRKHTSQSEFNIDNIKKLPKVDIIYSHAQDDADFVNEAVKNGAKGIIVAGLGNGNLFPSVQEALGEAVKKGVIVVRDSRVVSGETTQNGETDDAKYGFLTSDNLNPQKARILLQLGLTKTNDKKELQKLFFEY